MNIKEVYNIMDTLSSCGLSKCTLEDTQDGQMTISAIDEEGMTAVVQKIPNQNTIPCDLGVPNTKVFVNKMNLLNLDNTTVTEELADYGHKPFVKSVVMKEGRRSVQHTLADPSMLQTPIFQEHPMVSVEVVLDSEKFGQIKKAINTMKPKTVSFSANGTDLTVSFVDVNGDSYSEVVTECRDTFDNKWDAGKFMKLANVAASKDSGVSFGIATVGIIYFVVNDITVMLSHIMEY